MSDASELSLGDLVLFLLRGVVFVSSGGWPTEGGASIKMQSGESGRLGLISILVAVCGAGSSPTYNGEAALPPSICIRNVLDDQRAVMLHSFWRE